MTEEAIGRIEIVLKESFGNLDIDCAACEGDGEVRSADATGWAACGVCGGAGELSIARADLKALVAEVRIMTGLLSDRVQDSDLALYAVRREREIAAGAPARLIAALKEIVAHAHRQGDDPARTCGRAARLAREALAAE